MISVNFKAAITKPLSLAIILFFLSLFIRTVLLDKIPIGITNDNMIFVLNAKAVFYTGRDVTGTWHPHTFSMLSQMHFLSQYFSLLFSNSWAKGRHLLSG